MVTAMPRSMASRWTIEVAIDDEGGEAGDGRRAHGACGIGAAVAMSCGDEGEERAGEEFVGAGVGAVVGAVGVGVPQGTAPRSAEATAPTATTMRMTRMLAGGVEPAGGEEDAAEQRAATAGRTVLRPRVTRTAGPGWW